MHPRRSEGFREPLSPVLFSVTNLLLYHDRLGALLPTLFQGGPRSPRQVGPHRAIPFAVAATQAARAQSWSPRGCPQRVWPSLPNHGDRPTHSGPGKGGSRRPQPRCPIWPHDGAVGPAAEPPRIQPPRALTPDPPGREIRIRFPAPSDRGAPTLGRALAGRLRRRSSPAKVNQLRISCPSVTHQFHGAGNHPQGGRRGNSGRPGPGRARGARGARGAGFSLPLG